MGLAVIMREGMLEQNMSWLSHEAIAKLDIGNFDHGGCCVKGARDGLHDYLCGMLFGRRKLLANKKDPLLAVMKSE